MCIWSPVLTMLPKCVKMLVAADEGLDFTVTPGFLVWDCPIPRGHQPMQQIEREKKGGGLKTFKGSVCFARYLNMLATLTDLRLTALIQSLFLFSAIYLLRPRRLLFCQNTSHSLAAFHKTKSNFAGKKVQLPPCLDQSVSHLSPTGARIFQGASDRKSQSSGAANPTYITL